MQVDISVSQRSRDDHACLALQDKRERHSSGGWLVSIVLKQNIKQFSKQDSVTATVIADHK